MRDKATKSEDTTKAAGLLPSACFQRASRSAAWSCGIVKTTPIKTGSGEKPFLLSQSLSQPKSLDPARHAVAPYVLVIAA
jgi:hypothetical protein